MPNYPAHHFGYLDIIKSLPDYSFTFSPSAGPFQVQYMSLSYKRLGFQVSTRGELLSEGGQAAVAAVILTFVYLLIGFEVC